MQYPRTEIGKSVGEVPYVGTYDDGTDSGGRFNFLK